MPTDPLQNNMGVPTWSTMKSPTWRTMGVPTWRTMRVHNMEYNGSPQHGVQWKVPASTRSGIIWIVVMEVTWYARHVYVEFLLMTVYSILAGGHLLMSHYKVFINTVYRLRPHFFKVFGHALNI